ARGETAAKGHFRVHKKVKAPEPVILSPKDRRCALDVVEPTAAGFLFAEGEGAYVFRDVSAKGADKAVGARRQVDVRSLRNGRREDEAAVVVGVLADEVNPARGFGMNGGFLAEQLLELAHQPTEPSSLFPTESSQL